ncbi:hypothetical protein [Acidimangrovimonas sediminis]|uniref:hypothetical protein n=1 Tax=Acidimangrovimonas sediminis TaxID=2056283 RepID=UPI000C7FED57|nr:hypothetical protein [Acidimangrovimonas sediminis]
MRRLFLSFALLLSLGACAADSVWAPDAEVSKFAYVAPPVQTASPSRTRTLTLFTVVNNRNGSGGHSSLLVNAPTQQVIYDPAGTWTNPWAPERDDVHFGMTPGVLANYIDYHTRVTWHTVELTIPVSPEVAERALKLVEANGASPKAMCADNVSKILRQLPGFQSLPQTFFPVTLMDAFARLPGVKTRVYYDSDPDVNTGKIEENGLAKPTAG